MKSNDSLKSLVDRNAEQSRFVLGIRQSDADSLIEEILDENDIETKTSKLFRLLLDRLSACYMRNGVEDNMLISIIEVLRSKFDDIPNKPTEMVKWMCKTILNQQNRLEKKVNVTNCTYESNGQRKELTKEIAMLRAELEQEKKSNAELLRALDKSEKRKNQSESSDFSFQSNSSQEELTNRKNQALKAKNELYKKEIHDMNQKLATFSNMISSLKDSLNRKSVSHSSSIELSSDVSYDFGAKDNDSFEKLSKQNVHLSERIVELQKQNQEYLNQIAQLSFLKNSNTRKSVYDEAIGSENMKYREEINETKVNYQKVLEENGAMKAIISNVKKDNETYSERLSILRAEISSINEDRKKLLQKVEQLDQNLKQQEMKNQKYIVERDAALCKLNDTLTSQNVTNNQASVANDEIKRLNRECLRLETTIAKLKDELFITREKARYMEEDCMTLKKFGLELADALCSSFNPNCIECELERLLEMVRQEHNELNEVCKTRITQYDDNLGFDYPISVTQRFKDLDNEIIELQKGITHK